jgi:hypothetical protein
MHRIDDPSAAPTLPAPRAQGTPGFFTGGSPGSSGFGATVVRYEFMNALQEELSHVIESSGLTLNKTDNTQLLQALQKLFIYRTRITKNTTIYVNPATGSDSNDGLTAGTAFKTLQAAIYAVYGRFDWNNYNGTIQLADGTYNANTVAGYFEGVLYGPPFGMPQGGLSILGNPNQPGNVIISATTANCLAIWRCQVALNGISFTATGNVNTIYQNQGHGVALNSAAWVDVQNCRFLSCAYQVTVSNGSVVTLQGSGNSLTGATVAPFAVGPGGLIWFPGATLNVTGLSFSQGFVVASGAGVIDAPSASFIGSATGPRFDVESNGIILTNGGGANYFPGSTVGVQASGGQYL